MAEAINIRITLDYNVLISAVKKNEEYSKDGMEIINLVPHLYFINPH